LQRQSRKEKKIRERLHQQVESLTENVTCLERELKDRSELASENQERWAGEQSQVERLEERLAESESMRKEVERKLEAEVAEGTEWMRLVEKRGWKLEKARWDMIELEKKVEGLEVAGPSNVRKEKGKGKEREEGDGREKGVGRGKNVARRSNWTRGGRKM
jgi:chromosome segregation ATPase